MDITAPSTVNMSENIPESIPTSADRRSHRPTKKRALTPLSQQSAQVEVLFANPDREIGIPDGPKTKNLAPPPEIVANVQGSSAGAGSGEFHVYKASRRREYERLRLMDEEVEKEEKDREWSDKKEELKSKDEERLSKNQAKRAKAKARKDRAKVVDGVKDMELDGQDGEQDSERAGVKKRLGAAKVAVPGNGMSTIEDEEMNGGGRAMDEGGGITFHDDD